jgi:hypothetical protein
MTVPAAMGFAAHVTYLPITIVFPPKIVGASADLNLTPLGLGFNGLSINITTSRWKETWEKGLLSPQSSNKDLTDNKVNFSLMYIIYYHIIYEISDGLAFYLHSYYQLLSTSCIITQTQWNWLWEFAASKQPLS